eukprot:PhM_4_TR16802/c0_g1_i2/m.51796
MSTDNNTATPLTPDEVNALWSSVTTSNVAALDTLLQGLKARLPAAAFSTLTDNLYDRFDANPLYSASRVGNIDIVRSLLSCSSVNMAEPRHAKRYHSTALHVAVFRGHLDLAMLLRRHGASVSTRNKEGDQPSHDARSAMINGEDAHPLVCALLRKVIIGVMPEETKIQQQQHSPQGASGLFDDMPGTYGFFDKPEALDGTWRRVVELCQAQPTIETPTRDLVEREMSELKANIVPDPNTFLYQRRTRGWTLFHSVCVGLHADALQLLLGIAQSLPVVYDVPAFDVVDEDGWTPLHYLFARDLWELDSIHSSSVANHEIIKNMVQMLVHAGSNILVPWPATSDFSRHRLMHRMWAGVVEKKRLKWCQHSRSYLMYMSSPVLAGVADGSNETYRGMLWIDDNHPEPFEIEFDPSAFRKLIGRRVHPPAGTEKYLWFQDYFMDDLSDVITTLGYVRGASQLSNILAAGAQIASAGVESPLGQFTWNQTFDATGVSIMPRSMSNQMSDDVGSALWAERDVLFPFLTLLPCVDDFGAGRVWSVRGRIPSPSMEFPFDETTAALQNFTFVFSTFVSAKWGEENFAVEVVDVVDAAVPFRAGEKIYMTYRRKHQLLAFRKDEADDVDCFDAPLATLYTSVLGTRMSPENINFGDTPLSLCLSTPRLWKRWSTDLLTPFKDSKQIMHVRQDADLFRGVLAHLRRTALRLDIEDIRLASSDPSLDAFLSPEALLQKLWDITCLDDAVDMASPTASPSEASPRRTHARVYRSVGEIYTPLRSFAFPTELYKMVCRAPPRQAAALVETIYHLPLVPKSNKEKESKKSKQSLLSSQALAAADRSEFLLELLINAAHIGHLPYMKRVVHFCQQYVDVWEGGALLDVGLAPATKSRPFRLYPGVVAASNGHLDVLQFLHECNGNHVLVNDCQALCAAIAFDYYTIADWLTTVIPSAYCRLPALPRVFYENLSAQRKHGEDFREISYCEKHALVPGHYFERYICRWFSDHHALQTTSHFTARLHQQSTAIIVINPQKDFSPVNSAAACPMPAATEEYATRLVDFLRSCGKSVRSVFFCCSMNSSRDRNFCVHSTDGARLISYIDDTKHHLEQQGCSVHEEHHGTAVTADYEDSIFLGSMGTTSKLYHKLISRHIQRVIIVGFGLDQWVLKSAKDSKALQFETIVVPELCVMRDEANRAQTVQVLSKDEGIDVIDSASHVKGFLNGEILNASQQKRQQKRALMLTGAEAMLVRKLFELRSVRYDMILMKNLSSEIVCQNLNKFDFGMEQARAGELYLFMCFFMVQQQRDMTVTVEGLTFGYTPQNAEELKNQSVSLLSVSGSNSGDKQNKDGRPLPGGQALKYPLHLLMMLRSAEHFDHHRSVMLARLLHKCIQFLIDTHEDDRYLFPGQRSVLDVCRGVPVPCAAMLGKPPPDSAPCTCIYHQPQWLYQPLPALPCVIDPQNIFAKCPATGCSHNPPAWPGAPLDSSQIATTGVFSHVIHCTPLNLAIRLRFAKVVEWMLLPSQGTIFVRTPTTTARDKVGNVVTYNDTHDMWDASTINNAERTHAFFFALRSLNALRHCLDCSHVYCRQSRVGEEYTPTTSRNFFAGCGVSIQEESEDVIKQIGTITEASSTDLFGSSVEYSTQWLCPSCGVFVQHADIVQDWSVASSPIECSKLKTEIRHLITICRHFMTATARSTRELLMNDEVVKYCELPSDKCIGNFHDVGAIYSPPSGGSDMAHTGFELMLQCAPELIKYFFHCGLDKKCPFPEASYLELTRRLLKNANVVLQYRHLWMATRGGHELMVYDGNLTPLHFAALINSVPLVDWLVDGFGAELHHEGLSGHLHYSVMHFAALAASSDVMHAMVHRVAHHPSRIPGFINRTCPANVGPLALTTDELNQVQINFLIHRTEVDPCQSVLEEEETSPLFGKISTEGNTPLMVAVGFGHPACVDLLLDREAYANNVNAVEGVDAQDIAICTRFHHTIQLRELSKHAREEEDRKQKAAEAARAKKTASHRVVPLNDVGDEDGDDGEEGVVLGPQPAEDGAYSPPRPTILHTLTADRSNEVFLPALEHLGGSIGDDERELIVRERNILNHVVQKLNATPSMEHKLRNYGLIRFATSRRMVYTIFVIILTVYAFLLVDVGPTTSPSFTRFDFIQDTILYEPFDVDVTGADTTTKKPFKATLDDVGDWDEFAGWIAGPLRGLLFPSPDDGNITHTDLFDGTYRLVGGVRFSQHRAKPIECPGVDVFPELNQTKCFANDWNGHADRESVNEDGSESSTPPPPEVSSDSRLYRYFERSTVIKLVTFMRETMTAYPLLEGLALDIDVGRNTSYVDEQMERIQTSFFKPGTRLVTIQFTLYSLNTDKFLTTRLSAELTSTYRLYTVFDAVSVDICTTGATASRCVWTARTSALNGIQYVIIMFLVYLFLSEADDWVRSIKKHYVSVNQLYREREEHGVIVTACLWCWQIVEDLWNHFGTDWNIVDLAQILVLATQLAFQFEVENEAKRIAGLELFNKDIGFVDFSYLSFLSRTRNAMLAINLLMGWVTLLKCVSFLPYAGPYARTIVRTLFTRTVACFAGILMILVVAFALCLSVAFGDRIADFSSIGYSFMRVFQMVVGELDYDSLFNANYIVGPLLYVLFMVCVNILLLNTLIAIIGQVYEQKYEDSLKEWSEEVAHSYQSNGLQLSSGRMFFLFSPIVSLLPVILERTTKFVPRAVALFFLQKKSVMLKYRQRMKVRHLRHWRVVSPAVALKWHDATDVQQHSDD